MALFRQTGLICEDSIVHGDMNTVLNKKLETSGVDYPANSWAKNVNIMAVMPTKTASGSLLTISDSADDVQLKEGKFNIAYNSNGLSSMAIARCKKNFFNEDTEEGTLNDTTGVPVPSSTQIRSKTFSACIGGAEYYIYVGSNQSIRVLWYDVTQTFISETINIANTTATAPNNACFFKIRGTNAYGNTYQNDISVNYPSSETSYEAYSGDTYPVSFGTTIYGGYFESETGVLTSTKASDGSDLATPVEYQLAKIDVMLKAGLNNLFCTTGTSEVEYYTESSGGGVTPIFAATVLVDNSEAATSFTLSDDFEDYDFIAVEITSTSLGTIRIVTLPEIITEIFTYSSGKCCFDFWNSNNYCCYSHSGRTWTRTNNRYTNITKITGYKCTNATVTKTTVYAKQGISATGGVITSQDSLFGYDYLFFATCSGDNTETQPCNTPIATGQKEIIEGATYVENKYNQTTIINISEFEITTWANWFMCIGVKYE